MDKIDHRLEVLEGLIVAFLNLDRVIDIIRYDEDPKAALMPRIGIGNSRAPWTRRITSARRGWDWNQTRR